MVTTSANVPVAVRCFPLRVAIMAATLARPSSASIATMSPFEHHGLSIRDAVSNAAQELGCAVVRVEPNGLIDLTTCTAGGKAWAVRTTRDSASRHS